MAKIRINGDTSGYIEISAPAVAGSTSITLPATTGGSLLATDSNGNLNVDSGVLYVDGVNNRVGIGTTSPSTLLHLNSSGASSVYLRTENTGGIGYFGVDSSGNAYAGAESNDAFGLVTNGTYRMYITAGGNVGIGSTTPGYKLVLREPGATDLYAQWYNSSGIGYVGLAGSTGTLDIQNNNPITFATGGGYTERARIDTSGRLLVGTSSDRNVGGHNAKFQVEDTGYGATLQSVRNVNGVDGAYLFLGKSRGTTLGSNTIVQSGDELGNIRFYGADGSTMRGAAEITCNVDGTPGASDMPGRLVFSTTADGNSSPTERMRITNGGSVYVGSTSPSFGSRFVVEKNASDVVGFADTSATAGTVVLTLKGGANGTDSTTNYAVFQRTDGNSRGAITATGTNGVNYTSVSDYRLKENVIPFSNGINRLRKLKPSHFNFIGSSNTILDGFIAHEVQSVVPEAVTGEKDAVDKDGNPKYQGIDQSKLVPLLTAALQEAVIKIEQLEATNASFEARLSALEVKP